MNGAIDLYAFLLKSKAHFCYWKIGLDSFRKRYERQIFSRVNYAYNNVFFRWVH